MKKIKILLLFLILAAGAKAQFPNTDSARRYADKYIRSSVTDAFSNMRLNLLLKGLSYLIDSTDARIGSAGNNISNANLLMNGTHSISGNTYQVDWGTGGSPFSRIGLRSSGLIQLLGGIQLSTASSADASDVVLAGTGIHYLPQLATSNRNITLPTTGAGKVLILVNQNTNATYHWSFTNTVRDPKGNIITTVLNQTMYYLVNDGVRWVDMMSNVTNNTQLINGSFFRTGAEVAASIDSALNANAFTLRNALGSGDTLGGATSAREWRFKRIIWGSGVTHSTTDSTITVDGITSNIANSNLTQTANHTLSGATFTYDFGTSTSKFSRITFFSSGPLQLYGLIQFNTSNAGDANDVMPVNVTDYYLPTITAPRTVTFPANGAGKIIIIHVTNNSAFHWTSTTTLKDNAGTSFTQLDNNAAYVFVNDGTNWVDVLADSRNTWTSPDGSRWKSGVDNTGSPTMTKL